MAATDGPLDDTAMFLTWARYCQIHRNAARYEEAKGLVSRLSLIGAGEGLQPAAPYAVSKRRRAMTSA
jgi:hypothetical protein